MRPCQQLRCALRVLAASLRHEDYVERIARLLCCEANLAQYKGLHVVDGNHITHLPPPQTMRHIRPRSLFHPNTCAQFFRHPRLYNLTER